MYTSLSILLRLLKRKDPTTYAHAKRVAQLTARFLARTHPHLTEEGRLAGLLHDLGKLALPQRLLTKPTHLSPEERQVLEAHPRLGAYLLEGLNLSKTVLDGVLYHHEHWDGRGYPFGLSGEEIPLIGRILAITDAYEAMTSHRPYHKPLPHKEALEELRKGAGTQFDPELVELFLLAEEADP